MICPSHRSTHPRSQRGQASASPGASEARHAAGARKLTDHPRRMIPEPIRLVTVMSTSRNKDGPMSNDENGTSGPQFRSGPLIVSAVLVGAGTLIALTGLAVGGG